MIKIFLSVTHFVLTFNLLFIFCLVCRFHICKYVIIRVLIIGPLVRTFLFISIRACTFPPIETIL